MFPTFIGILDIQSWWEVPSIAHFCSLFRAAFNLLDFDIEDLEEALLTDGGTEGRLVQELIVRLLEGCLPNDTRNDISTFNYQMFLRRLFRKKCQEYKCENPFNTDVDFELLPLRQKVEILRALCDFRLDAEDVEQSLGNLDSDSLRVEPLGHDRKNSAYWYFYGTRLYREDYIDTSNSISHKQKSKPRDKKRKRRRNRVAKEEEEEEEKKEDSLIHGKAKESVWQVVCFTQQDWSRLVEKFRDSEYDTERKLYRTLSEDFMPEIPKLFDLKEKQQRRKLLQRNSSRVLRSHEPTTQMETVMVRSKIKTKTNKGSKKGTQNSKNVYVKEETPPPLPSPPIQKKGRQTNNSLASAVGQIVIHTRDEVEGLEKKKGIGSNSDGNYVSSNYGYKYGYSFGIEEEERRVGMHKVLESLKDHVDAWPFIDPVDEEYAPRYYSVVRKPMDLSTMEEKLENGLYKSLSEFKRDFRLIVDNCRQYNGSDNEYTEMAFNLKEAFDKAVGRYLESETSSDEDPSSPKSFLATPASPSCPSRVSSPHQNRKRSKKSTKKSKSYKSESKGKSKANDKNDEEEKRGKNYKLPKKKRGKKKSKRAKDEESVNEEEQEEQESEDAMSESSVITAKRNNLLLKTKKLTSKESEEFKKIDKKVSKERHQQKKETENVRPMKESKENKKRKEDFEEDYEPLVVVKSKNKKIEKKELEETEVFTDNAKKNKLKKTESHENEPLPENKEKTQHIKVKKNRKKEKTGLKAFKSDEKSEKSRTKDKEKKSKQKNDELKNGEISSEIDSKDLDLESDVDSKETHTSKKIPAFIGDKDIESLDGLKDKISERRREEKLKNEKEKQKKTGKNDLHNMYSKKVPSNGSTFHDSDKSSVKRPKLKKGIKEEKVPIMEDPVKTQDQEVAETKKVKVAQSKHTKGFGKEESSMQALNQATEQTLHDINKWLDDAPRLSEFSSGSDSPIFHSSSVESGRSGPKVEAPRKRPSSIKIFGPHGPSRPKKIQRTIDRLQPGKSKGNLLLKKPLNLPNVNAAEMTVQLTSDNDQTNKNTDEEPKLSLGTVLKNVDSIQLICKSLVSSPNPNFSNDDEEEDHNTLPAVPVSSLREEKISGITTTQTPAIVEESKDNQSNAKDTQKPKTATPNLSAWFKAFGAPKSKKKDEESEDGITKKDGELQEVFCGRQRRMSTGGSSVSESVSSFSQESPPGRSGRSPQGQPIMASVEPQIRGAGFYQDALSTGSSPYNSPYYATPPRYSAQLPPTPSPQNHPLSPAYPSSSYEQAPLYSQIPTQQSHQTFQKSPQENSGEMYHQLSPTFPQRSPQTNFPQNSTQNESYNQPLQSSNQSQSPVYSQHSPQPIQQIYPQPSPQPPPSNYSQPSPQQPSAPKYSQLSPQQNAANYSQPSPQAANYSQPSPQQPHSPYSQASPQAPPNYSQPSPQQQPSPFAQSPQQSSGYSQMSPQPPSSNYSQQSPQPPSNYSQQSPQPPSNYSQPSPQTPSNYSQASPQPPSNYSQPSPQPPSNYSQPSPQPPSNYSQPSPQPPSNYSQPSPQPPSNYSQPSPQPPPVYSQQSQSSNFSHPSPQTHSASYTQSSPQPLTTGYSQPSPQPRNYSQPSPQQIQTFPQHSPQAPPSYSQPSPQNAAYSQPQQSPQQPVKYSQPSPQQPANYSHSIHSPQTPQNYSQLSPQQPPPSNYSQPSPSPQQSRNYSQTSPSPQQSRNYSQPSPSPQQSHNYTQPAPSPQQTRTYSQPSPQQKSACTSQASQSSQQPSNYSQPSPQQSTNYSLQQPQPQSQKSAEEYPQAASTPSNYSHGYKQNHSYIQSSVSSTLNETEHRTDYLKSNTTEKSSSTEQQRNFAVPPETASLNLNANHQIYQSPNQYPPTFGNNYPNIDLQRSVSRHGGQEQSQQQQQSSQERPSFTDLSNSLNAQKYAQQRSFLGKTSSTSEQLSTQDQSQILAFQQNLTAHESLYPSGFQSSGYPMPNSRPVYPSPHYFDASSKAATNSGPVNSSTSNLPPVKKRIYNESSTEASRGLTQETTARTGQEQFSFDPIMALPQPEAVSASQFDTAFVGNLADSVATNPAYARLGLGLVSRTGKEQQQLLTIPRPPQTKPEHLAYARSPASGAAEIDLNLLQSLQTAAAKNTQGILSMPSSRRGGEASSSSTSTSVKTKKSRKSKQQQQEQQNVTSVSSVVSTEPQSGTGIPGFPQYTGTSADSIGLKNTTMVPPAGSAFNFAASTSTTTSSPFYDKDASAAAAAFAFLDEFRNPNSYYSMALRQQQQQQQQQVPPVTDATQQACNKLSNQPPRNYPPHPFLHSAQRSAAYGPPVSAYVTPHGPNLTMDPTAYQQYIHSLYALQPPPHHHRPSWL
ncbi:serine/arginine repetitive matrix protein 2 isoform X5 [Bombus affinis]|uniref:serine/arginine repetitive matrix protein 2 isoform X5 n=1 Tax=Bombus affinis TaxID=309941 RepID=UPI0021B759CF|nr:serine/arginine repetitive matrix protein 2 isoform X5 [Bombus affinis]